MFSKFKKEKKEIIITVQSLKEFLKNNNNL